MGASAEELDEVEDEDQEDPVFTLETGSEFEFELERCEEDEEEVEGEKPSVPAWVPAGTLESEQASLEMLGLVPRSFGAPRTAASSKIVKTETETKEENVFHVFRVSEAEEMRRYFDS